MTLLTYIALMGSLAALGLGIATLIGERGYAFELRRRRPRRQAGRLGGRRAADVMK